MPSAPINSVASALNFGNCRTVISGASSTTQEYTAVRYRRVDGLVVEELWLHTSDTNSPRVCATQEFSIVNRQAVDNSPALVRQFSPGLAVINCGSSWNRVGEKCGF